MQFARVTQQRLRRDDFLQTHSGIPQVFSQLQVDNLNASRPDHDQLELAGPSPSLLLHRCCFPGCEYFLVDMRSPADFLDQSGMPRISCFFVHCDVCSPFFLLQNVEPNMNVFRSAATRSMASSEMVHVPRK